ncbi:MAG: sulfite reductase [Armatimonadetes bacterium CG07_land_8_20_14_0_80_59_28]|nr:MAG: sulfite reductase [Armatimonadetes bacterium CG07_land_8_20_14_0_80_59_28]PIX40982.1 MAG: sulfite reductase [Armatimonadetes bacterium CG_4_8_14_3_um_filter_58_9]PIY44281.1 MAG: sulfite reductase [Armatimonadetes bacterium CG_4_10_14_3_um_filter_59_10]
MTWKEELLEQIPEDIAREIDIFSTQIELRKQGKVDEKVFAETRLRRGAYGQRYDNGQRHDGIQTRTLQYPSGELTKGPDTLWDAPGMQRIKIPFGGLSPAQMDVLADLAEEYSDAILHVTTRQDIQLHFVHIDDTPDLMRRLAAVGITTREAGGNVVRNVTACPIAGVCRDETFDVTPYARACAHFMLGHPDAQNFGRKVKIAFSGCREHACALVAMHDLGAIGVVQNNNGKTKRGFAVYVGGGLGAVPYQAKLFDSFVPEEELLPIVQAVGRVFSRLGERRNRARARIKFLVEKLGMEEFKRLVMEEREILPADEKWTTYIPEAVAFREQPLKPPQTLDDAYSPPEGFTEWRNTNVYRQRQEGYAVATVTLPLGDITATQLRKLSDIARNYIGSNVRTTVEQNIVLRWVNEADLPGLYAELAELGLGQSGAGTIVDITACPGTDTCKLGIASSRGLAAVLSQRLAARGMELDEAVRGLKIKISGCFNSCGQHHLCDIGFYGNSRTVSGRKVPHFQAMLGGKWQENAGAYGLAIGSVPSRNIPEVVDRIADRYVRDREKGEAFLDFTRRIGKRELRAVIEDLMQVPTYEEDASYYSDWGDPREFTLGDLGTGECAGEAISVAEFGMSDAERLVFEAQLFLEDDKVREADQTAFQAMLEAAKSLVKTEFWDVPDNPDSIVNEFQTRFYDTDIFQKSYGANRFALYLLLRHKDADREFSPEKAHKLIEEAQLFIEATHACHDHLTQERVSKAAAAMDDLPI